MKFGTQFSVTMMLIEYLITYIIFFLRIFYSSFPKKKIQIKKKDSTWMSKGQRYP